MSKRFLPPDGGVLNAFANANLSWLLVLGEWIDNAFDAGAKTVCFDFSQNMCRISDDGNGCNDPTLMIRLGGHQKHATTKSGRYGIGGKDAALWVGGLDSTINISTIHEQRLRSLTVNWREYGEGWKIDEITERAADVHERGTFIKIAPRAHPIPSGKLFRELLDKLGYFYAPAIKLGLEIKIKGSKNLDFERVKRWEPPVFDDGQSLDTRITVNDRSARVYCGIVKEGLANPRSGFTYWYGWRVIDPASAKGCGEHSISRFCGFVELDSSWSLTKNKDAISKDAEALYAEVERVSLPILKRGDQIGQTLRSNLFESRLNEQLNRLMAAIKRRKGKRDPGDEHGTRLPTGTGGPHKRAEKEQPGDAFEARGDSGLKIEYGSLDSPALGQFKPPRIILNLDNPVVAQSNRESNVLATMTQVAVVIALECGFAPEKAKAAQMKLPGLGISLDEINESIGNILSSELELDGRSLTLVSQGREKRGSND